MVKTLRDRLKEAYAESAFKSYASLARAAGLKSPSTISGLMSGDLGQDSPSLVSLANVLNVSALWLMKGSGPKEISNLRLAEKPAIDEEVLRRTVSTQRLMSYQLKELLDCYLRATDDGRATMLNSARRVEKVDQDE